jgi:AraC-like DNA-binding protein
MSKKSNPASALPELVAVVHSKQVFDCKPPRRYIHAEHVISILIEGTGTYHSGNCDVPIGRPIAGLLPSGEQDVNGLVGPGESWFCGFHWPAIAFDSDGSREYRILASGKSIVVPRFKLLAGADVTRVVQQFSRMKTAFDRQDVAGGILARSLFMELFAIYIDLPDDDSVFVGHRALARFCELLQSKSCDDVSIEDLAGQAGITADHLRELFRLRFGMRPLEYRTGLRLARARELLSTSTLNVKEVAHKVGFSDALYFSRVFKQHFGMSPSDTIRRFRLPSL